MSFWTDAWSAAAAVLPNTNGPADPRPGDVGGLEFQPAEEPEHRAVLPFPQPSAWDGWGEGWSTPAWQQASTGLNRLVDIAWTCIDLNSNIISSMPCYQTKDQQIIPPEQWMNNPDPDIYSSWQEFAKQLFTDYQLGEAFVLPFATRQGKPVRMRVIPPFLVNVDLRSGRRFYKFAGRDVTEEILHIRYSSSTIDPRGHGPLEQLGARQTQIRLLTKYVNTLATTGGVPLYWLEIARKITASEGQDLIQRWIESRAENAGHPALVAGGAKLHQANSMNAQDMALLEISQFSESRIAVALGVPPFLVGLAGATGSLTYSNIADLFDFHDRSSLRPKVRMVMEGLSGWALPNGRGIELNRDDYTRLPFDKRMQAYETAIRMKILTPEEVRIMERFYGETSAQALTGGIN